MQNVCLSMALSTKFQMQWPIWVSPWGRKTITGLHGFLDFVGQMDEQFDLRFSFLLLPGGADWLSRSPCIWS